MSKSWPGRRLRYYQEYKTQANWQPPNRRLAVPRHRRLRPRNSNDNQKSRRHCNPIHVYSGAMFPIIFVVI
eukprot:scaffold2120_cov169-Amphora_coffeaeformis.AAC.18